MCDTFEQGRRRINGSPLEEHLRTAAQLATRRSLKKPAPEFMPDYQDRLADSSGHGARKPLWSKGLRMNSRKI
jgi:hypothetical protein